MYCGGIEPPNAELSPVFSSLKIAVTLLDIQLVVFSHFQYDKLLLTTKIFKEPHLHTL